jgi:hypothetical protein
MTRMRDKCGCRDFRLGALWWKGVMSLKRGNQEGNVSLARIFKRGCIIHAYLFALTEYLCNTKMEC